MNKSCYFINPRPLIAIERAGGKQLGRCYYMGTYKITSLSRLTSSAITKLWEAGLLGAGQTWQIASKCNGSEEPAGFDLVEGTMMDDAGNKLNEPPTNWFGEPVKPSKYPYYEYITNYYCDSGD